MRLLKSCNGNGLLMLNRAEEEYSIFGPMKKAVVAATHIKKGQILSNESITFKRTSQISDISPFELEKYLGGKVVKDIEVGVALLRSDFE